VPTFARFNPCPNPCCAECQACLGGQYPAELTVTFASLVNGQWCEDCVNANGAWVLQQSGSCSLVQWPNGVYVSYQNYQGSFPTVNMCQCAGQQATLDVSLVIAWNYGGVQGQRAVAVSIGNSLGCLNVSFFLLEQNQSGPFDCQGFAGLSVPYSGSALFCASPNATCEVSA
jgi:hypothetical protein